jgi:hypothetical protein
MARAIWSGVISFGLVSVPVELKKRTSAVVDRAGGLSPPHLDSHQAE